MIRLTLGFTSRFTSGFSALLHREVEMNTKVGPGVLDIFQDFDDLFGTVVHSAGKCLSSSALTISTQDVCGDMHWWSSGCSPYLLMCLHKNNIIYVIREFTDGFTSGVHDALLG
jgi:hypothetical protein